MSNRLVVTSCVDPYRNLALEAYLFDTQGPGATLYLWQNQNTVVIGRNQNAWKECRVSLLESEGGRLARRSSGGGAVFHDLGNLNFTFLLPRGDYDPARQFSVLQTALRGFGVEALVSGRNDLALPTGEKCSGNAFRFSSATAMHHGTLLVSADMDRLGRYLAPSERKLRAKGVESVRARVKNLSELVPGLLVPALTEALKRAFCSMYGPAETLDFDRAAEPALEPFYAQYASWDWRYGKTPAFDVSIGARFPWGEIDLLLSCKGGCVDHATVYTDAMDETMAERLTPALEGARYAPDALSARIAALSRAPGDPYAALAGWVAKQRL